MNVCVLASGSAGNSTFIESKESSILIDAGISQRKISKNLSGIGKDLSDIDAIFVTHEHTDHVSGLDKIDKNIPVYLNKPTYKNLNISIQNPIFFSSNQSMMFNELVITPVRLNHDAAEPCGFKIQDNKKVLSIFTDLGKISNTVSQNISESDCIVLETNYDIDMLIHGPYTQQLKQRILSDQGHLSNIDAALCVKNHSTEKLRKVFLAHISKNNNTQELACNTFKKLTRDKIDKILTSQEQPTELFKV